MITSTSSSSSSSSNPQQASLLQHFAHQALAHYAQLCQARAIDTHKGKLGTLGIIGGSVGMAGAPILAAQTGLKQGCGKVWIGFDQISLPLVIIPGYPEIMLATASGLVARDDVSVWVLGCGLESHAHGLQTIFLWAKRHAKKLMPTVWDAGALQLLAQQPELAQFINQQSVLTPHAGEAARLLNITSGAIDENREHYAQALAQRYRAWVVLKGHHSIIISPTGEQWINTSGNAGLATAGSGDALAGLIGSLLAQGMDCSSAIRAGVWLHGCAAQYLAAQNQGPVGLIAGELADAALYIRNYCITFKASSLPKDQPLPPSSKDAGTESKL